MKETSVKTGVFAFSGIASFEVFDELAAELAAIFFQLSLTIK
ncbi:MAG: hypothetical protein QMC67_13335 [Candidatus Wallbacteria bacterium]